MNSSAMRCETEHVTVFGASARVPLGSSTHRGGEVTLPRPFGLRFARVLPAPAEPVPPSRFCPDRQIAVTIDGTDSPWYKVVGTSMSTTGQSTDGTGSTGGEEWTPDQGTLG